MSKAILARAIGGPEVLSYEEYDPGKPGPGEILVRQAAAGLNFVDVYFRTGLYKPDAVPFVLGREGAGTVAEVGEGVSRFKAGDRVAYNAGKGTYAELVLVNAEQAAALPDAIDFETAAAAMLKGMTAEYLLRRTFPVGHGTTLLIHAAAGGVGLIAGQWAKHLGATVIGTAGSKEKCDLALANGYDHVINYREEDFVERVRQIRDGRRCDVVYDSVGKDTYLRSLDCLKPRGLCVLFGQSSGRVPDFDLNILNGKGSLFTTRPSLMGYTLDRSEFETCSGALFDVIASGAVKIRIDQRYPLERAADAHRHLESRNTTGATIFTIA